MAGQLADLELLCQSLPAVRSEDMDGDDANRFLLKLVRPGTDEVFVV